MEIDFFFPQPHLRLKVTVLATKSIVSISAGLFVCKLLEAKRFKIDGERALASFSHIVFMSSTILESSHYVDPCDAVLAHSRIVLYIIARTVRNFEPQDSKTEGELAFASAYYLTTMTVSRRESQLDPHGPAVAPCAAGLYVQVRSVCTLFGLQGPKTEGEFAFASSYYFIVKKARLGVFFDHDPHASAIAPCAAGLFVFVRSVITLFELQGPYTGEGELACASSHSYFIEAAITNYFAQLPW